jgi:plastocyanin
MRGPDFGRRLLVGLAVLILSAGCSASASLAPSPTPTSPSAPASQALASQAPASQAPASQVAAVRCAETPNAAPSATVQWTRGVPMGAEPTIKAGQAVAFVTTGFSPTVTEWINGTPAASPCIDKAIGSDTNNGMSVVVTFYQPGDYNITCRVIPLEMHTIVHVH